MQLRAATKQTRFESSEKGSIQSISKKGFHQRFYRHIFSWFIYPLPFETSGTASRGSMLVYHVHETTLIVLFGPTLAAMCTSVCCFKEALKKNASIAALSF